HIAKKGDAIREYLTGDVLGLLQEPLALAEEENGAEVRLALYELGDEELSDALIAAKSKVHLVLSNSSKARNGDEWDAGNAPFRSKLVKAKLREMHDRMFNNEHIGHNKFGVLVDAQGKPKAVVTGSTNWTPTGLCAQSNNAMLIENERIAAEFVDYWKGLVADT